MPVKLSLHIPLISGLSDACEQVQVWVCSGGLFTLLSAAIGGSPPHLSSVPLLRPPSCCPSLPPLLSPSFPLTPPPPSPHPPLSSYSRPAPSPLPPHPPLLSFYPALEKGKGRVTTWGEKWARSQSSDDAHPRSAGACV